MNQIENAELSQSKTAEGFADNDEAHKKEVNARLDYERAREVVDDTLRVINKAIKDGNYKLAAEMELSLSKKQQDVQDKSSTYAYAMQKRESVFHQIRRALTDQIPREAFEAVVAAR